MRRNRLTIGGNYSPGVRNQSSGRPEESGACSEDPDTVTSRVDDLSAKVKAVIMGFDDTMRMMALADSLPEGQDGASNVAKDAETVRPPAAEAVASDGRKGGSGGLARLRRLADPSEER